MASNRKAKAKASEDVIAHCKACGQLLPKSKQETRVAAVKVPVRQFSGPPLRPVHLGPPPTMAELARIIPTHWDDDADDVLTQ